MEVIAVDGGSAVGTNLNSSLPVTFTILPTEVNDAPEFTLPTSTTSREDVGLVTLNGFVTGIRRGPQSALDETNQTLSVQFSFDANAFSQAPQLNLTSGTLTYATAAHVNSFTGQSLVVTVTIFDSGRNDAPNVNTTVKSFTINVTPVNDAPGVRSATKHQHNGRLGISVCRQLCHLLPSRSGCRRRRRRAS